MHPHSTCLVVDIGNTSTSLGLFASGDVTRVGRIEKVEQTRLSIASAINAVRGKSRISVACLASVVPSLVPLWCEVIRGQFGFDPLVVRHDLKLGVKITYPKPSSIGADRLANAVGAVCKYGAPVIIADFGTAVTFDLVTRRSGYIGGIIAPGLPLMFDYLAERTAQLPHIEWGPVHHRVGKTTAEAMQLGAHWGYRGMVREILTELLKVPALKSATLCATGGYAGQVLKGVKPALVVDAKLTLFGIGQIALMNL